MASCAHGCFNAHVGTAIDHAGGCTAPVALCEEEETLLQRGKGQGWVPSAPSCTTAGKTQKETERPEKHKNRRNKGEALNPNAQMQGTKARKPQTEPDIHTFKKQTRQTFKRAPLDLLAVGPARSTPPSTAKNG